MITGLYTIKSSPHLIIYSFIRGFLNSCSIGLLIYVLLSTFCPNIIHLNVVYIALIILACINLVIAVYIRNIKVDVTENSVTISRFGKALNIFNRKHALFSSFVETHSVNGFPVYAKRFLKTIDIGSEASTQLYNISSKDFNNLISMLTTSNLQIALEKINKEETIQSSEIQIDNAEFAIPKSEFLKYLKRLRTIIGTILLIIAILFTIWYTKLALTSPNVGMSGMIAFFSSFLFGMLFVLGTIIPLSIAHLAIKKQIPEHISIQNDGIKIDTKLYQYSQIATISMTPPLYESNGLHNKRYMYLDSQGKPETFYFGSTPTPNAKDFYQDYDKLCEAIRTTCINHKIKFIYDLK